MQYVYTTVEGRNQSAGKKEERQKREGSGRGRTLQRLSLNSDVNPEQLTRLLNGPNHKIPFDFWFNHLLPAEGFTKYDDNGNHLDRQIHKPGPHMPELEALTVDAPTKKRVLGRDGTARMVVANARPLYLYERKNTLDRPADEKECTYGKIRDPTTNSWRCIKNPNHHKQDTRQMHND
jgi:hypothetical protein